MNGKDWLERLVAVHLLGGVGAILLGSDALLCWCYCATVYFVWRWGREEVEDSDV